MKKKYKVELLHHIKTEIRLMTSNETIGLLP